MTHLELLQAARKVRDELGRRGSISVNCDVHESDRHDGPRVSVSWTISYHDSEFQASGHIQVSLVDSSEVAIRLWEQKMRSRFSPKVAVSDEELACIADGAAAITG